MFHPYMEQRLGRCMKIANLIWSLGDLISFPATIIWIGTDNAVEYAFWALSETQILVASSSESVGIPSRVLLG